MNDQQVLLTSVPLQDPPSLLGLPTTMPPCPAWVLPVADVLAHHGVQNAAAGLNSSEVEARRAEHGFNELEKQPGKPTWKLILEQFDDTLVKVRRLQPPAAAAACGWLARACPVSLIFPLQIVATTSPPLTALLLPGHTPRHTAPTRRTCCWRRRCPLGWPGRRGRLRRRVGGRGTAAGIFLLHCGACCRIIASLHFLCLPVFLNSPLVPAALCCPALPCCRPRRTCCLRGRASPLGPAWGWSTASAWTRRLERSRSRSRWVLAPRRSLGKVPGAGRHCVCVAVTWQ